MEGGQLMTYVAFVPARSGSKRLPNKNIKMLGGKPLVVWTLEACVNAPEVDEVIFSTDSEQYWDIVKQYISSDKLTLDDRTAEEAGDKIKIFDYLKDSNKKIFSDRVGKFILALPTMPLRNAEHISKAIALSVKCDRPVFSAVEYDFSVAFGFSMKSNQLWEPLFESSPMLTGNTRSQDQADIYHPDGAVYVRDIEDLNNPELKTLYDDAVPMIMSKTESVDIDNEVDFQFAEALISIRSRINAK